MKSDWIIKENDAVLVTGANGFIGSRVAQTFLKMGFREVRALVRPGSAMGSQGRNGDSAELVEGNLHSPEDCQRVVAGVKAIVHLAAGADKSFAGSYHGSVIGTRNLLAAAANTGQVQRFVNISSFAVYSNWQLPRRCVLDESCPVEQGPHYRHESYAYAKAKQDELVQEMAPKLKIPYVILRPGAVFGPRSRQYLSPRVGIDTFGIYLHLGGSNRLPLTYVDNCAEAIALATVTPGVEGEVFNVVDDDLPTSRDFLRQYKRQVRSFPSLEVPYSAFYFFSWLWERYSMWSNGQFGPVFNRRRAATYWKGNRYSNAKAKQMLGWTPRVPMTEAARMHFEYFRNLNAQGA